MTTSQQPGSTADQASSAGPAATVNPRTGLSELVVPGVLVAIAIFLIIGTVNMKLPPSVQVPGPTFFPTIVIGLLLLMATLSTVQILRNRAQLLREARDPSLRAATTATAGFDDVDSSTDLVHTGDQAMDADGDVVVEIPPDVPPGREPWPAGAVSDWRALGIVLASLIACIVLLEPGRLDHRSGGAVLGGQLRPRLPPSGVRRVGGPGDVLADPADLRRPTGAQPAGRLPGRGALTWTRSPT